MGKFFPMPQELQDIHLGGIWIDNVVYGRWIQKEVDGKIERTGLTEDDLTKLEVKYGARDWYDWAITMYGCKWDATATIVDLSDDKTIHLLFETPWSPPEAFVKRLSERYPDLHFELAYCEGGSGYWGTTSYANGCIIESTYNEDGIYSLVPEEADYDDYDLLPEAAAHIEKYHIGTGG